MWVGDIEPLVLVGVALEYLTKTIVGFPLPSEPSLCVVYMYCKVHASERCQGFTETY